MKRFIISALLAVSVFACTAGCLSVSADELYSLPEVSEEYLRLQAQINILLNRGAAYAAPTGGANRQAVQLIDINGSGDHEVIVFFTFPDESKLRIYIFTLDEGDYITAEIIESAGTEIESVRYIDMNGDGNREIIIGWHMGTTIKYMSIYSLADFHSQLLVSGEEYNEIAAYDSVGVQNAGGRNTEDIVVLKMPTQETGNASAKLFSFMPDGEIVTEEARLSAGIESISRIIAGRLADGVNALFVESEGRFNNGSLVTDILARRDGSFTNISLSSVSGISVDTVRNRTNSADIMSDGIVKIPMLRRLMAQSQTEYYATDWYDFKSNGSRTLSLTTYHNTFDEWYLILPRDWRDNVSVRRDDSVPGERTIIFSYFDNPNGTKYDDFLKIYRLSGENADERATQNGKKLLLINNAVSYAFEFLAEPNSFGLTFDENTIRGNFRLMHSEWE